MNADPIQLEKAAADFPHLVSREAWGKKISSAALGAKNIKRLLSKEFPELQFRVKSDIYSGGSAAYIYWDERPGQNFHKKVDTLASRFQYRSYNGMDDSYEYDNDPYNNAFRQLFGAVSSVVPQPRKLAMEDLAEMESRDLQKTTAPAPTPRRAPRL